MKTAETINQRIALLVKEFGNGRNTTLASLIESNEGNIRGYVHKGVIPKQDVLERIVKNLGVNAAWLLTGEGPMIKGEEEQQQQGGNSSGRSEGLVSIPIVDIGAAAGIIGYENPDYLEVVDTLEMPFRMVNKRDKYYCIRLKGESMSPTMLDSGYLVVRLLHPDEWQDIINNQVYVISTRDGSAYVKRIKNRLQERGFIVCSSDNPNKEMYPNFNIYQEEIHSILRAEWYFTAKMPNIHETYYKKVEDLEKKYDDLQEQIEEMRNRMGIRR